MESQIDGRDSVVDKRWEASLRWFRYIKRNTNVPMRRCERLTVIGQRRGGGRPRKNWRGVIRYDMTHLQLTEDLNLDRGPWRSRIRVNS